VLNAIDTGKRTLNIAHEPIAALHWPGMTMDFRVAPGVDLSALKPGATITFTLERGADGLYAIDEIRTK
jgi:Cu/Ag efflux protein CusF